VVSRNAFKGGTRPEARRLLAKANQSLRNQLGILKKLEVETRETD
jgi:hypothetical protein